jgi:mono/diheme cytochrome c family protein
MVARGVAIWERSETIMARTWKTKVHALICRLVLFGVVGLSVVLLLMTSCSKKEQETPKSQPAGQPAPQVPSFADKSSIPASGQQGPPGEAASLTGVVARGDTLFAQNCAYCHGPKGTDKVPNKGSDDGTVPALAPIDPELADKDPGVFASNIDRYIQHGSIPDGPQPSLFMPDWGDSKALSQQEIADLEAYIMHLNGVSR